MYSINTLYNRVADAAVNGVSTLVESGKYLFRYGSRYYVVNADFNPRALEEGVWTEFGLDEINPDDPLLGGLPDDEQFELIEEPVELNSDSHMARWSSPMETPNVDPFVTYVRNTIAEQMMQGFTLTTEEKMSVGGYVQAYNIAVSNNDTNIQELQTQIRLLLQTLYPHLVL
jgi:hypothetical protein